MAPVVCSALLPRGVQRIIKSLFGYFQLALYTNILGNVYVQKGNFMVLLYIIKYIHDTRRCVRRISKRLHRVLGAGKTRVFRTKIWKTITRATLNKGCVSRILAGEEMWNWWDRILKYRFTRKRLERIITTADGRRCGYRIQIKREQIIIYYILLLYLFNTALFSVVLSNSFGFDTARRKDKEKIILE